MPIKFFVYILALNAGTAFKNGLEPTWFAALMQNQSRFFIPFADGTLQHRKSSLVVQYAHETHVLVHRQLTHLSAR